MYCEKIGDPGKGTVVMLHGAFFTDTFGRQRVLQDQYHLIIPHLMGYGKETSHTFQVDKEIENLKDLCRRYDRPALVGFSLGAQLAFRLICEEPQMFSSAVIVSPWLMQKDPVPEEVMNQNLKMYRVLQDRKRCTLIALVNGMPSARRKQFVEEMQHVSEETVRNSVDNGISFESVPDFENVNIPVLALAGAKEPDSIISSVKQMAECNEQCVSEVWKGAAHNIPPVFYRRFNKRLREFIN